MNLLFVSASFYPAKYYGGPIYCSYELALALARNGINVSIVTTNANGNERLQVKTGIFQKLGNILKIKYHVSQDINGTSLSMLINLWKDIKENDIVYLISVFSPPTPLTLFFSKIFNKKVIIAPHGQLSKWSLSQGSKLKKTWLKIFVKPYIKNLLWHLTSEEEKIDVKLSFPNADTFVVPNGIDLSPFGNIDLAKRKLFYTRYSTQINEDSIIIISMGRIHKKKGFSILVDSFQMIKQNFDNIFLFIAGEDYGEKKYLIDQINELKLDGEVFFIGHVEGEGKINFLKNADVFALPSYDENFGIVYAEALAAGTPIIASRNTPWQDVEKYNCGKWVENTPEQFSKAIEEVLKSDYTKMGLNGCKYVEAEFKWDNLAQRFIDNTRHIL